ncbi:MAG TPA: hypothetical protein VHE35_12315 [Kofleriaceae bacterium]|nr:hypothetical protein [Kofleriaceae bacterium]
MSAAGHVACEACGASLEVRPGDQATLVCPSCGHEQPIEAAAAPAEDDYPALLAASLAANPVDEHAVLTCATCGAQTTVPATVLADRCPFCGTPAVAPARDRLRRPSAVLPFRLDEQAARDALVAWQRGLWFAPGPVGPADGAWALSAVYLPYWSFDWDVTTDYEGARGSRHDNKTVWTAASGTVRTKLRGSTVLGSRGVDREQGAELEPWDTDQVVGFKDDYLQGVRAEQSGLSVGEAGDLGHRLLERQIEYDVHRDLGGEQQRIDRKTSRYHAAAVRLVLMPIWVTSFDDRGRRRQVLVNARTGEVVGDRPVSRTKVVAAAVAPFAAAVAGGAWLPAALHWKRAHPLRGHALAFWLVLGAIGLVAMIAGSVKVSRARRGRARQRDLYIQRQGAGTSGLDVDLASTWHGALQGDPLGQGTLVQVGGFMCFFLAFMPGAALLMSIDTVGLLMMHAFSAVAVGGFVYAIGKSARDRRRLLGLDGAPAAVTGRSGGRRRP